VPFLRVIRDKRGYETTYLMDWYRDGGRQRSRILYVFRSPGGVRVGRVPLDQDALRQIESQYPDIAFDWRAVFDSRQIIDAAPEPRRPRRSSADVAASSNAAPTTSSDAPAQAGGGAPTVPTPPIPATLGGETADERVAFLAQWYPIARERVLRRMHDPVRREALLALAERLNPTVWTSADEVSTGLEHAAEALERLSRVLSRRRRRSGRRGGAGRSDGNTETPGDVTPDAAVAPETDEADAAGDLSE
jgi:hypothetical protein